jgi:hypothetical protein
MYRAIFAFDFRSGQVAVIPQHWFNEGSPGMIFIIPKGAFDSRMGTVKT